MKHSRVVLLLLLLMSYSLWGQSSAPTCSQNATFTSASSGAAIQTISGGSAGCALLALTWSVTGFTAVTVQLEGSQDGASYAAVNSSLVTLGTNPTSWTSSTPSNLIVALVSLPYFRVRITSATGSGTVKTTFIGYTAVGSRGGGGGGGGGLPGGLNGQIQYRNGGAFGGATGTLAGGYALSGTIADMFTADANLGGETNYYNPVLQLLNGPTLGFGNGLSICNTTYAAGDCANGFHFYQESDGTVSIDGANDSAKPLSIQYHPATAQLQFTSMADMVWTMTNGSYIDTGTTSETAGDLNMSLVSKVNGSSNGEPNLWFTAVSNDGTHSATMTEVGADIKYNNSGVFLSGANWHVFDFVNSKNVLYQNPVDAPDLLETTAQIGPGNNGASYTIYGSIASTAGALNLVSTLANGATDSINFKVGNNGATSAGTIDHAGKWTLPVQQPLNTRTACMVIGANNGVALADADLGPQTRQYFVPAAATLIEIEVSADAGTPSIIVGKDHNGTTTNLTSSALATAASGGVACSNTGGTTGLNGVTTCSATLQNRTFAAGDWLYLVSGTAGGTAKQMTACATLQY